jgi:23S rRNA pseudouridine2605 synthase
MELVEDLGSKIYPVGRLDMDSDGLLLMTNDGRFANAVAHPSNNKSKTYEIDISGDIAGAAEEMSKTMQIDGRLLKPVSVQLTKQAGDGGILRITINEGRNRQLRKMCAACGLKIKSLRRVSIGSLQLGNLKPGHWRHLSDREINSLMPRKSNC